MKSKLAIAVALFGWVVIIVYVLYEYSEGKDLLKAPDNPIELLFHIIVLSAPIASTITAYLINERRKFFEKTQHSENKLKNAAKEWRETFDAMPYGLMLVDNEFNILRANKYISELSGIPIKELVFNKKCYELLHRQDMPLDNCPLQRAKKSQATETIEYYDPFYSKYFMSSVSPIFDAQGNTIAFSHPLIDITDLKNKEESLVKSRNAFFNMLKDIDASHKELEGLYSNLVVAFANAIDAKSPWTKGHSERVTNHAILIAKKMGLEGRDVEALTIAGLLHDIGKIGTYDILLDKPERLSAEEFALVKRHTIKGEEILKPIKELGHILPIIRLHHEKFDGTGYPDELKGDEIPLLARILCISDSYDSMVSDRPYRRAPGKTYAIEELKRCSGTHFDPQVVEVFLKVLENKDD